MWNYFFILNYFTFRASSVPLYRDDDAFSRENIFLGLCSMQHEEVSLVPRDLLSTIYHYYLFTIDRWPPISILQTQRNIRARSLFTGALADYDWAQLYERLCPKSCLIFHTTLTPDHHDHSLVAFASLPPYTPFPSGCNPRDIFIEEEVQNNIDVECVF